VAFNQTALGVGSEESVISRLPVIVKQGKPSRALVNAHSSERPSSSHHRHRHHYSQDGEEEASRKRHGSLSEVQMLAAEDDGGGGSKSSAPAATSTTRRRSGSTGEALSLMQQLDAEKEKRASLEADMQRLQASSAKLANDLGELHTSFVKLQQQYWVLMYEAEERSKQLEELRQSSEMVQNRLMRDIAKANEALGASKYTIQSNTQKVNRLEKTLRDLSRENRSLVMHVIVPTLLKWLLEAMSLVLVGVASLFRITKRLAFRGKQEQTPQTILRAEGFVQSAQLWMEQARANSERRLSDAMSTSTTYPTASSTTTGASSSTASTVDTKGKMPALLQ